MTDVTISVRIDKDIHRRMKEIEHINWSAIIRKALQQHLEEQQTKKKEKIKEALEEIRKIRGEGVFDKGRTGVEIIREWRDKRKF